MDKVRGKPRSLCVCKYIWVCVYVYIERERDIIREGAVGVGRVLAHHRKDACSANRWG